MLTDVEGLVVSCAVLERLGDTGATFGADTEPVITQFFPFYFSLVLDNKIRSYNVVEEKIDPNDPCTDTIFDPWNAPADGTSSSDSPVGSLSRKGIVPPNYIADVPLIGRASIAAHRVSKRM